jgi:chromosome segregation ATPase
MGSLARLSAQVGTLTSALEKERVRRTTAESEAASLREQLVPFKDELVVAFGTIEEIGRDFGSLFSEAQFLTQMEKEGRLDEEEVKRRLAKFYRSAAATGDSPSRLWKWKAIRRRAPSFSQPPTPNSLDLKMRTGKTFA